MRITEHYVEDDKVEALIFDVDGTLVDTMPHHYESWRKACELHNLTFTEEQFYAFAGRPLPDIIIQLVHEQHKKEASVDFIDAFLKDKKELHARVVQERGHPKQIESVVGIAREMKAKGVKVAAASSGLREHVMQCMQVNNLFEIFEEQFVVVAADLPPGRGKPEPDIFLEAAKRLKVNPVNCRAYEDGESGLQAANAAGMEVIDVRELSGYPLAEALRVQLPSLKNSRTWLKPSPS